MRCSPKCARFWTGRRCEGVWGGARLATNRPSLTDWSAPAIASGDHEVCSTPGLGQMDRWLRDIAPCWSNGLLPTCVSAKLTAPSGEWTEIQAGWDRGTHPREGVALGLPMIYTQPEPPGRHRSDQSAKRLGVVSCPERPQMGTGPEKCHRDAFTGCPSSSV